MALIYIVEDDESIREIETIALKNSGHMVGAFGSSKEFFKKLDEILPDLVLLDVMLPDESGYDIIKKLRLNSATKRLPVIMVTAKSTELDMIKGLEDGADDYIKKPFSVMELITRVKALLRRTETDEAGVLDVGEIELILVLQGGSLIIGQGIQVPVFLYTILYIGDKTLFHYILHI